jgi:predicted ribosomally synthesized peptide with SipW-like signal peptide
MRRRKILAAAAAVCVAAVLSFGTIAYFTASDSVTNQFMVASYDPDEPIDPDNQFSIRVYETDEDGQTTTGKTYEGIVPGDALAKDPTVQNTGKYSQWVRMSVTVTNAEAWMEICARHGITDLTEMFGGYSEKIWTRYDAPVYDSQEDTLTYVFYLDNVLKADETAVLFTTFTVPASLEVEDMVELAEFQILISADAIQSANTGASAKTAFDRCWE